jgi:hypothetical protein
MHLIQVYTNIIKNRKKKSQEDENMIYRIKVEGKEYNENYTFETPKEGDILDELKAIVEDMKEGNIDKLEVEREA